LKYEPSTKHWFSWTPERKFNNVILAANMQQFEEKDFSFEKPPKKRGRGTLLGLLDLTRV